ncbi:MAG: ComEC/Rec2 family competence protein [Clostridium sp.]|uniref:ComEC/Rec2 family competence protein n=1 Tax=Clostridium sp. TaxID=1506 RepID=UPI002910A139|nr:ComEC/Rec2 family competence protein [Clostridium sp.]MDU7338623.1 ComEC/Rec2 family competence protein [Clostridium sp.]
MKRKGFNVLLWILSVFFFLSTFIMFSTSWAAVFFIVPAVLLNPAISNNLHERFKFSSNKWVQISAAVIPLLIYSAVTPAVPDATGASTLATSSVSSSISVVSSQADKKLVSTSGVPATPVEQPTPAPKEGAKLNVHYIDVGQGDSEFLELPNGQTMLIDAGNPDNGKQIVDYIKGLGYSKIDYLIATHPHADHIGGMATVVNGVDIGKVYMPKASSNTRTFEDLLKSIQKKGLKINTAKYGVNILKAGNLNIDIIAPVNVTGDDLNQYSAVTMLTYGDSKFLFTGDAGVESEKQITADVKSDVLKVGHHGSKTSTSQEFLNRVNPKYAVIEVGKDNSYGHPTAAALAKLEKIGATIYRTDKDGTIIFTSDSKTITVNKKSSSIKEQAPPSSAPVAAAVAPQKTAPVEKAPEVTAPATENKSYTVYITKTGGKYHTGGCRYLKKSKIAISLSDAQSQGYSPCSVCNP